MSKTKQTPVYGIQNEHIIQALAGAYKAVLQLVDSGFTVIDVSVAASKPIITIQNCIECKQLKGSERMRKPGHYGLERIFVSIVKNAQVEWTVRGN